MTPPVTPQSPVVPFWRRPRFWGRLLLGLAFLYAGLILTVHLLQDHLLHYPDLSRTGATPAQAGLAFEEAWLPSGGGHRIQAWWVPAPEGGREQTVLLFHGATSDMGYMLGRVKIWHELGFSVALVDYQGYGLSEGRPSEAGTYEDAQAAWNWLTQTKNIPPEQIIIHGYSLGGGVASWLAAQEPRAAGLILEATFTNFTDAAQSHAPLLPLGLLMPGRYDTLGRLPYIRQPLLVVHSPEDQVVPYRLGRRVFESYQGPKNFLELHGRHLDAYAYNGGRPYAEALKAFAEGL